MAKTDLLTLLEREHRDLEGRLKMIISTGEACQCVDAPALRRVINHLLVHLQAEEAFLYPRAKDEHEVSSLIPGFYDEHDRMKALLESLVEGRQVTTDFRLMLDVCHQLLRTLERHVHDEEGRLFPVLRAHWEEAVLMELGDFMLEMKDRALTGT
jgi:hemerythrin superfamily protein